MDELEQVGARHLRGEDGERCRSRLDKAGVVEKLADGDADVCP